MSKSLEKIVAALAAWQQHARACRRTANERCNAFHPKCRRGKELFAGWRRAAALPAPPPTRPSSSGGPSAGT